MLAYAFGGLPEANTDYRVTLSVSTFVPDIDYACAFKNKIYAVRGDDVYITPSGAYWDFDRKIEDVLNAGDSWHVTTGTVGDFTGIVPHRNYVLAFKRDYMFKFYGETATQYGFASYSGDFVLPGTFDALCSFGDMLYMLTANGICRLSGDASVNIDEFIRPLTQDFGLLPGLTASGAAGDDGYLVTWQSGGKGYAALFSLADGSWSVQSDVPEFKYPVNFSGSLWATLTRDGEYVSVALSRDTEYDYFEDYRTAYLAPNGAGRALFTPWEFTLNDLNAYPRKVGVVSAIIEFRKSACARFTIDALAPGGEAVRCVTVAQDGEPALDPRRDNAVITRPPRERETLSGWRRVRFAMPLFAHRTERVVLRFKGTGTVLFRSLSLQFDAGQAGEPAPLNCFEDLVTGA